MFRHFKGSAAQFTMVNRAISLYCPRKNLHASGDHDQGKEALLHEGGDRPTMERASIQNLRDKFDCGDDVILEDEVKKWKAVISVFPTA